MTEVEQMEVFHVGKGCCLFRCSETATVNLMCGFCKKVAQIATRLKDRGHTVLKLGSDGPSRHPWAATQPCQVLKMATPIFET